MSKISVNNSIVKATKKVVSAVGSKPTYVLFQKKHIVESAAEEQKKQEKTKKKSTWIFLLCNILIVGGIILYTLLTQETKPLGELLSENPYYRYLWMALFVIIAFYLVEGVTYSLLLKITTGKFNYGLGVKVSLIGKYWDNITPMGSGGQFAQVAYISSKGNTGDISTSVIVGRYLLWQIAYTVLGIAVVVMPYSFFTSGAVVKYMALAGVILNALMFAFILLVSVNRKACSVLVVGGLKLLAKMHIVKNYQKALYKTLRFIQNYQNSMKHFIKKPLIMIAEVLLCALSILMIAFVSFLIYKVFNPFGDVGVVQIVTMSLLCTFATTFIPIPGGSGAAEVSFVAMFSKLFTEGTTFWALMFWRFFTYYLFIIAGFSLTIIEPIIIKHKQKKILKGDN